MRLENSNILLSEIEDQNYVQLDNEDFLLRSLNKRFPTSKGSTSNSFILHDPSSDSEDKIIKICKSPLGFGYNTRIVRFKREITAFKKVKKRNLRNVIEFYKDGYAEICGRKFYYFVMEKAECDLAEYLEKNRFVFTINQKLAFCTNILNGIKQLHSIGIYHRDIKHDNILVVNGEFKISDLGLIKFRNSDNKIDFTNEKIGPIGWLSPEATNKMLTYNKNLRYNFDCDISQESDIFQLGKLFWYVFQGNLPIGQILNDDFEIGESEICQIILSMLQYKKIRRPSIENLEIAIEPLKRKYGV